MARTIRGCQTAWSQPDGTLEPESNASVPQLEEEEDATDVKVIVDCELNVDYEPEGPD